MDGGSASATNVIINYFRAIDFGQGRSATGVNIGICGSLAYQHRSPGISLDYDLLTFMMKCFTRYLLSLGISVCPGQSTGPSPEVTAVSTGIGPDLVGSDR